MITSLVVVDMTFGREFLKDSTIPTLHFATRAKATCLTIFWILVFFGLTVLTFYQMAYLIQKLQKRETFASIIITSQPAIPFPSVTVCNLNAYKRSALESYLNLSQESIYDTNGTEAIATKEIFDTSTFQTTTQQTYQVLQPSNILNNVLSSCPGNFSTYDSDFPNICYSKMNSSHLNFTTAMQTCASLNPSSSLPIFRNESEYISFQLLMQNYYFGACLLKSWLGLTYNNNISNISDGLQWIDGSPVTFQNWNKNYPDVSLLNGNYVVIQSGKWKNTDSSDSALFLCQLRINEKSDIVKVLLKTVLPTTELTKLAQINLFQNETCPNSSWFYDSVSGICYLMMGSFDNPFALNWRDTSQQCNSLAEQSTLPYFCSDSQYNSFLSLLSQVVMPCHEYQFLGYINNILTKNTFTTADGKNPPYFAWNRASPICSADCVEFLYPGFNRLVNTWVTTDCSETRYIFFCQLHSTLSSSLCNQNLTVRKYCDNSSLLSNIINNASGSVAAAIRQTVKSVVDPLVQTVRATITRIKIQKLLLTTDLANMTTADVTNMSASIPYIVSQLSAQQRIEFGYSLDDLLLKCKFGDVLCDRNDIVVWNAPETGNCFTFNHRESRGQYVAANAGPAYGLSMLFNTSQDDYLDSTISSGLKIYITHRGEALFSDSQNYIVPGGFGLDIPMKYKLTSRLEYPYGNCHNGEVDDEDYFFEGSYTVQGCYKTCQQKLIFKTCSCGDPTLPLGKSMPQIYSYCDLDQAECVSNTLTMFNMSYCTCPLPCVEHLYDKTPNLLKIREIFQTSDDSRISGVSVYLTKMVYIKYEETVAYDMTSFVSDLGNIVGINLGAAFHTIGEFILLILWILASLLR